MFLLTIVCKIDCPIISKRLYVDGTGIQFTSRDTYMRSKYRVVETSKRNYMKCILVYDDNFRIIAAFISDKNPNEGKIFEKYIVDKLPADTYIYADKAYSSSKNYKLCKQKGITLITPIKKNELTSNKKVKTLKNKI